MAPTVPAAMESSPAIAQNPSMARAPARSEDLTAVRRGATAACRGCGRGFGPEDRFCAGCGTPRAARVLPPPDVAAAGEAPTAARSPITIERPPRVRVPRRPGGPAEPAPGGPAALWAVLALVLVCGAVLMVLLAAGVFSATAAHTAAPAKQAQAAPPSRTPTSAATKTTAALPQSPPGARAAVLHLATSYASTFSRHDLGGLARIFAPDIVRRGLVGSRCAVSTGRSAVLADYAGQFQSGTGQYTLTSDQVQLNGATAVLAAHYAISTGGAGPITFTAGRGGGTWQIVRIDATCG